MKLRIYKGADKLGKRNQRLSRATTKGHTALCLLLFVPGIKRDHGDGLKLRQFVGTDGLEDRGTVLVLVASQ